MTPKQYIIVTALPLALVAAADQSWKDKQVAQWTEADAKQVLTDSPWAKQTTPSINNQANQQRGGGRRRGGFGIPGMGYPGGGYPGGGYPGGGYPGGGGRYPGGGYPGGGGGYPPDDSRYPQDGSNGGSQTGDDTSNRRPSNNPPALTVRWESAQPVQEAQLKAKESNMPSVDPKMYAIAVIGLPARMARDPQMTESHLKGQAELKRDGKKLSKPSDVRVISRDDSVTVVFLFPRNKEIKKDDRDIEFDANLGRYEVKQYFDATEMVYQGKLEL